MIKTAVIGTGGIGMAAATIMDLKSGFQVVGLSDKLDLAVFPEGVNVTEALRIAKATGRLADIPQAGLEDPDPLRTLIKGVPDLEGLILSVPSIPHDLVTRQVQRLIELGFKGAVVDVLDQSIALEHISRLRQDIRNAGLTYITGCGATPGLLTAAASLISHSFLEVDGIRIRFGVGITNYLDRDEASLREILAGFKGMGVERAETLTRDDIHAILEERKGIVEVSGLAHGDDVLIEWAGVTSREKVEVGGRIDTKHDIKPVSTTVTVIGRTFDECQSSHTLTLGDETSMFANTAGPAVGYLARAVELNRQKVTGLFGSTDLMPLFIR